jgi:hypothetical protein
MSTVDPSIPLSGQTGFDVSKIATLADMGQQFRMRQAAMQKQNALAQILANPQSYNPDGTISQNALPGVMAANPQVGIDLKNQSIQERWRVAQEKLSQTETGKAQASAMLNVAGVATNAYRKAKEGGANEQQALDAANKAKIEAAQLNGSVLSPDQLKGIQAHPFDPIETPALASMDKDWVADQRAQEVVKMDRERNNTADRRADTADKREATLDKNIVSEIAHRERQDDLQQQKIDAAGGNMSARAKELRASLAEMGVSFPSGMRSVQAQNNLLSSLVEKHPDASPDDIAKLVRSGAINMKVEQTEGGVLGRREAAILPVEQSIIKEGGFLDQAEAAVNAVDFPKLKAAGSFDKWGKDQLSDPKLTAYKAAVAELRAEYSIVLSKGGQVTDAARHEAEKVIPDLITKEQFKSIRKTVKQGIESSKAGVEDSISNLEGGKKENSNNTIHWDDLK